MTFIYINLFIDKIEFSIAEVENNEKREILEDKIIVPKSFNMGDKLNYIRKFMVRIINQYKIEKAYMSIEDRLGVDIINIVKMEGVIEELLSNCGVKKCI